MEAVSLSISRSQAMTVGRSLELYYIDDHPDGMVTAEMFNWTGRVLLVPRTQIAAALAREQAGHTGVYLLLGERDGQPLVYVGESEDIGTRLRTHDVQKDWWTSAVFVTASGNQLNKAHARYLEARLVQEANSIGRTPLANVTTPTRPGLSEADIGKMEAFLQNLFMVLPAVRVDVFVHRSRPELAIPTPQHGGDAPSRFVLTGRKHGLKATAVLDKGEFVVEAGSLARLGWEGVGSEFTGYSQLHTELRRAGVLRPQEEHCVFTQNYVFKSPSAAAAVVTGRPTNGTLAWRTEDGATYKEWEARNLGAPEPAMA